VHAYILLAQKERGIRKDTHLNVGLMAIYSLNVSGNMSFTPFNIQQEEKLS
jgi:hypothetical protein